MCCGSSGTSQPVLHRRPRRAQHRAGLPARRHRLHQRAADQTPSSPRSASWRQWHNHAGDLACRRAVRHPGGLQPALDRSRTSPSNFCRRRSPSTVQLMVMEKANTLDLAFFEDATFYDALQRAQQRGDLAAHRHDLADLRPGAHHRHALSMISILDHLAWWMALLALIAPIPAFFANVRYGWWGYQMMRRQSPLRREMGYYNNSAHHRHLQQRDQALHPRRLLHRGSIASCAYRFYDEAREHRSCRATSPPSAGGWAEPARQRPDLPLHRAAGRRRAHHPRRPDVLHAGGALPRQQLPDAARAASPRPTRTTSSSTRSSTSSPTQPHHRQPAKMASSPKAMASPSSSATSRFTYPGREERGPGAAQRQLHASSRARRWRWWDATARARPPSSSC